VRGIGPLRMTGSDVTGSDVTESDVSHVTGSNASHVTGSDVSHCPEVCSAHVQPEVGHIRPNGTF